MTTPEFVLALREKIGDHPLWLPGVKGIVLRAVGEPPDATAEVLLVQRRDNGRWTVPAGILEPGEEPADGIAREVFEETGVTAEPVRLVGVQALPPTVYPNGDRARYLDVIVALDPRSGEAHVHDDESIDVAWRAVDDLADVPPLHRRAIEWALSQDPRFAPTGAADPAGWFVHDGRPTRPPASGAR
ncbi:NUDIX domain-containing protein [Propioniciclava coleopterorum]|uniref:NUDIX domain-containing protein n=1 Tax=Propioniciclava coleopterorum TaxID=2714937 RepID=A0A6G7Y6T3_9ACTN|nr:NUDIX domain-containing protein [Propioniciclava coleopterorum]QIK72500.1 NUDIX domain-containing protein [Propioniciclava coleopterorum]